MTPANMKPTQITSANSDAPTRYKRPRPGFEAGVASALALLRQAAAQHPGSVVQASSLGAEDMVITDLIAQHRLPIAVATLDTGRLHPQTLALIPRIQAHYGLTVELWQPVQEHAVQFVAHHGAMAMRDSIALRKACCQLRKLEPLSRLLQGRSAWVTGLRREQSGSRANVPFVDTTPGPMGDRSKFNPLADWTWGDVWQYIARHRVPYNPLHDNFYPSIGCEPCTRAVALGEDPRAGRWWWEQADAKECGLHVAPPSAPTPSTTFTRQESTA